MSRAIQHIVLVHGDENHALPDSVEIELATMNYLKPTKGTDAEQNVRVGKVGGAWSLDDELFQCEYRRALVLQNNIASVPLGAVD